MHPMMMALANEVEKEREQERQNLQMRSLGTRRFQPRLGTAHERRACSHGG